MFEKIMVPLDGSELAEASLDYAEELSIAFGSEVVLLHIGGLDGEKYHRVLQMYLNRLAETVKENIEKKETQAKQVTVTTRVETGEAGESICKLVEKNNIELIIMTSVSVSGLRVGKMLGSVTERVCRTVPIPVLLMRPESVRHIGEKGRLINQILLPLDGSELGKTALPIAEELASTLKANITIFQMAHMIPIYDNGTGGVAFMNYAKLDEAEKERVDAEMLTVENELKNKQLSVSTVVTSGFDAGSDIIETGKKVGADLVIMSTHGRSGLGRWFFGNTAEKVLRHGDIPLLLVNAKAD